MRVNWLAIVVSAIAFFLFGSLWYDLLFGKAWLAATNLTPHQMQSMGGAGAYPLVISLVMAFFLAYGLARILGWRGEMNPVRGALIGLSMGLLIFGSMTWMDDAYEMRGITLGLIDVGYVAIGMAIQGAILGAWRKE
jgi:hypothetical protein